ARACPSALRGAAWGLAPPSRAPPPPAEAARLPPPFSIPPTGPAFVVVGLAPRHTLASYLSMHPAPDTTASAGHFVSGPLGGLAAPAAPASSATASAVAIPFEKMCRMTRSFSRVALCRSVRSSWEIGRIRRVNRQCQADASLPRVPPGRLARIRRWAQMREDSGDQGLAGATEPEAEGRKRRIDDGRYCEYAGVRAVGPEAAPNQRAWEGGESVACAREAITAETTPIIARDGGAYDRSMRRPVGAVVRDVAPIRHPLPHVPHHVEGSPARLAARPRSGVRGASGVRGTRRRAVVGVPRVWCACRRALPLLVSNEAFPRQRTCLRGLEPRETRAGPHAGNRHRIHAW